MATHVIPTDVDLVLAQIHDTQKDKGVKALKADVQDLIAKGRTSLLCK